MTSKTFAFVAVVVVLTALLCNTFAQQPGKIPNVVEEPKLLPANALLGRYQITSLDTNSTITVIDTHTGQCWTKQASSPPAPWRDLGSPVIPAAPKAARDSLKE